MDAGFLLLENQLLIPAFTSFTSGKLRPRNTSYLHVHHCYNHPMLPRLCSLTVTHSISLYRKFLACVLPCPAAVLNIGDM